MPTVTIGGEVPEALIDIKDASQTDTLGSCTIVVGATQFNKQTFSSGDKVVIERAGGDEWTGYLTANPTDESKGTIEIKAMDSRYELKESNVSRPFFQVDSGEIVRQVIRTKAEERGSEDVHRGSSLAGWESDMDVFELGNLASKQLHEKGDDVLFGGIREGGSGTYRIRFTDVPSRSVPGRAQIYKLETRLMVNDNADQITGEVELVTDEGLSLVWEIDPGSDGFTKYELALEDAEGGEIESPDTLEYRFKISGDLADNTGFAIDYATTYTFEVVDRESPLGAGGVRTTERAISRRFDESALDVIQDLGTEENYHSWVDSNEVVYFEPVGSEETDLQIVRGETAVTAADFDRDYDGIVNEVKVQGDGIQENVRDAESIRYYGVSSREEALIDESIKTSAEAQDRGNGYLAKHAWDEVAATFTIADTAYQSVEKGSSMFVDWPSADLTGYFVVNEKEVDSSGQVTLGLGVRA
ncbi:hypothetical protein [Natronosalvus rutilus]|uniref:Uncharacterized protein n=1 Tax=Natronosalvus rutilus TaxID=2953753 RepID=A0A9E7SXA8_9EURY|nr:hypothetical protein [Natronosalvus rutilus]UTF55977.1 hypothetical protein NGM29_21020 [Natronosalvus rutilus]